MVKKALLLAVTAFLLSGCGSLIWYKPGATVADLNDDQSICSGFAMKASETRDLSIPQGVWYNCMAQRGWTQRRVKKSAAADAFLAQ